MLRFLTTCLDASYAARGCSPALICLSVLAADSAGLSCFATGVARSVLYRRLLPLTGPASAAYPARYRAPGPC